MELNPGPVNAAAEQRKQTLATALLRCCPLLQPAEFDFAALAVVESVSEQEARRRYRHLEFDCDDDSGMQITLWDECVEITIPDWHIGEQSRQVLQQVWQIAGALEESCRWSTYDLQLRRVLKLGEDFDRALKHYLECM